MFLQIGIIKDKRQQAIHNYEEEIVVAIGASEQIQLDKKTNNVKENIFLQFPLTDEQSMKIISTLWNYQSKMTKTMKHDGHL